MTSRKISPSFGSGWKVGRSFPAKGSGKTLDEIRLCAAPNGFIFGIQDVAPWGVLLPEEFVTMQAAIFAEMDAHRVPYGSEFIVHLVSEDGSDTYEFSYYHMGPDPVVRVRLPNAWFEPHSGKRVSLHYEVVWSDGIRYPGPGIQFRVQPALEVGRIHFDGVNPGEPMDPALNPDGIAAAIERIPNIESFHSPVLIFGVNGVKNGFIDTVTLREYKLSGLADGPDVIKIDKDAYTGIYEQGYTEVHAVSTLRVQTVPMAPPAFEILYDLGRMDILPPRK